MEAELARTIGAERVIWLERGLTRDYDEFGTRGHVDIVATFAAPGTVLVHRQDDPAHPDYEVSRGIAEQLRAHDLTVIDVPAPRATHDEHGPVDYSYINHTLVNGGVILCGFGEEEADTRAAQIMAEAYPGRRDRARGRAAAVRPRRRHPLHHPAAARGRPDAPAAQRGDPAAAVPGRGARAQAARSRVEAHAGRGDRADRRRGLRGRARRALLRGRGGVRLHGAGGERRARGRRGCGAGEIEVEPLFTDGHRLVVLHDPIRRDAPPVAEPVEPEWLEEGVALEVVNEGAVPVGVTSHFHFFETNRTLRFDRAAAWGLRLAIAPGAKVVFNPDEPLTVHLTPIAGARIVRGHGGLVDGPLDAEGALRRGAGARPHAGVSRCLSACGWPTATCGSSPRASRTRSSPAGAARCATASRCARSVAGWRSRSPAAWSSTPCSGCGTPASA